MRGAIVALMTQNVSSVGTYRPFVDCIQPYRVHAGSPRRADQQFARSSGQRSHREWDAETETPDEHRLVFAGVVIRRKLVVLTPLVAFEFA